MQKANLFFILSAVADHIVADFRTFDATTLFTFRHELDKAPNRLQVQVARKGKDFIVSYDAEYNGKTIVQAASLPIPADQVQAVIAQIANDAIPAEVE